MCILFFCQTEICQPGGYQLIAVNNRDEAWSRPTKEADFWGKNEECISGLDLEPGRVGGTWLGMNKAGKIGVLLNILGHTDLAKLGRGHLVSDYVQASTDISDYASKVLEDRDKYNGFNLVLFDLCKQEDSLTVKPVFVSNASGYSSCVTMRTLPANTPMTAEHLLQDCATYSSEKMEIWEPPVTLQEQLYGSALNLELTNNFVKLVNVTFVAVSNSPLEYPFQKAMKGKEMFGRIVSQYPTTSSKEDLVKGLMDFMADRTPYIPDPVLEKAAFTAGYSQTRAKQQSAISVWSSETQYGSRTTTLVLVDSLGHVDYIERTITSVDSSSSTESTVHKNFQLTKPPDC